MVQQFIQTMSSPNGVAVAAALAIVALFLMTPRKH